MPQRLAIALLLCLAVPISSVLADDVKTNTFDRHELTLTNGSNNEVFGWIELLQGNDIAGYLYVTGKPPREPYLSADKKYIVMDFPIGMLDGVLGILRNEKPLQIRYEKHGNTAASAFIERARTQPLSVERRQELSRQ